MILKKTILSICLFSVIGLSSADDIKKSMIYVGAHAQIRHTNFDKNFGSSIMRKNHHQGHAFVGFRLTDNIALEVGSESMVSNPKQTTLHEGDVFNGIKIPNHLSPSMFVTEMKLRSMNADLLYFYKIFNNLPISFIPSIGISHITINIERESLRAGSFDKKIPTRVFKKSFLAIKPSAALQYDFENGFSIRTSVSFINSDLSNGTKMKTKDHQTFNPKSKPRVNLKDSFVFGLGFSVNI